MENLAWVIMAIGLLVGGLIMMFGLRQTDQKPMAFGQIHGALKQDPSLPSSISGRPLSYQEAVERQHCRLSTTDGIGRILPT